MADPTTDRLRRERVAEIRADPPTCCVVGCHREVGRGGKLSRRYCGVHLKWMNRHGSPYTQHLDKVERNRCMMTARVWMRQHRDDPMVKAVLNAIEQKMLNAPAVLLPFRRYIGQKPKWRASRAWSRLREAGVKPEQIVIRWIGVYLAWSRQPYQQKRYRLHQTASLVHRMQVKTWEPVKTTYFHEIEPGRWGAKPCLDYRKQMCRGRYAVRLGEQIDELLWPLKVHCKWTRELPD